MRVQGTFNPSALIRGVFSDQRRFNGSVGTVVRSDETDRDGTIRVKLSLPEGDKLLLVKADQIVLVTHQTATNDTKVTPTTVGVTRRLVLAARGCSAAVASSS